ncbi:hypothetical protein DXT96_13120 [Agrobacterium sp. ICMP 6402]|nr:hypothetical protein [Agrobacterium sp. ICMP 6402]
MMPKFVGPKATIVTGGTKLWKATAKHAATPRVAFVAGHRKTLLRRRKERVFRRLWWKLTNGCKLGFWI